jgi:hypothetical protein
MLREDAARRRGGATGMCLCRRSRRVCRREPAARTRSAKVSSQIDSVLFRCPAAFQLRKTHAALDMSTCCQLQISTSVNDPSSKLIQHRVDAAYCQTRALASGVEKSSSDHSASFHVWLDSWDSAYLACLNLSLCSPQSEGGSPRAQHMLTCLNWRAVAVAVASEC